MKTKRRILSWLRMACVAAVSLFSMSMMAQSQDSEVFSTCEVMPSYPGGDMAMMKFLCDNMKYPQEAQTQKKQGRVVVQMVVQKDGSLADFKVQKSVDPFLDAEALRVAKLMPKFTPGKQNGKPVNVRYSIPITFRLN